VSISRPGKARLDAAGNPADDGWIFRTVDATRAVHCGNEREAFHYLDTAFHSLWMAFHRLLPAYLGFALGIGRLNLPDDFFVPLMWSLFLSHVVGVILALIASIKNRGWLLFAVVWIAACVYEFWDLYRHPIDF
jgi:hypothetical protein